MVLKYSFELFFLKCILELKINRAPLGSNSVNGRENHKYLGAVVEWPSARLKSRRGYFPFFFLSSFFFHPLAARDFCENVFLVLL